MLLKRSSPIHRFLDILIWHGLLRGLFRDYALSIDLRGNERVLDFGCRSGALSRGLAEVLLDGGGSVTCLDTSARWIEVAQRRLRQYPNVAFLCGDIRDMDLETETFDVVTINFVLFAIDRDARPGLVAAFSPVLKQEGTIFIQEPTNEKRGMAPDEIRDLLSAAGWHEKGFKRSKSFATGPFYTGTYVRSSK